MAVKGLGGTKKLKDIFY
ncbi:hypothetical protein RCO48_09890 [Peribacillus frigoritolerans]|nr:hypothetical protein [Peribacillus frigoritolerans]